MAYLAAAQYTPITVTRLAKAMTQQDQPLPARPVAITFDDGFADFVGAALPILQQYGFVATMYVATAFIGATSRWLRREGEADRPMMTWADIRDLSRYGIECGGHTQTHPQLDLVASASAWQEITCCKDVLEHHIGDKVVSFAYPYGYWDARVRRLVQAAGYTSACAVRYTISSLQDDRFALARLIVTDDLDPVKFAAVLRGGYRQLHPLAHRVRATVWRLVRRNIIHRFATATE